MGDIGSGAIGGSVVAASLLGLLAWVLKRAFTAILGQNKTLVDEALANMKANTAAIEANTGATRKLSETLNQAIVVRDERDRTMFKQLDRIEDYTERASRRRPDSDLHDPKKPSG